MVTLNRAVFDLFTVSRGYNIKYPEISETHYDRHCIANFGGTSQTCSFKHISKKNWVFQ